MSPIDPGQQLGIYLFATRISISGYRHTSSFFKASYSHHATGFPAKKSSSVAICRLFFFDAKIVFFPHPGNLRRQRAAREGPFCALCRRLRCANVAKVDMKPFIDIVDDIKATSMTKLNGLL